MLLRTHITDNLLVSCVCVKLFEIFDGDRKSFTWFENY